jgi:phage RecT family recombinase
MPNDNRRPPPQGQRPQQARPQQQQQTQTPPQGEQRPPSKLDEVRTLVKHRMTPAMTRLLAHRSVEDRTRFAQVFLNALEVNPDLIDCSPGSIARAMQHCAEVDLVPGGAYPHAYLIPYWNSDRKVNEVQFQISVWGYVELIRRSGQVKKVWADVIYSGDVYETTSGTDGKSIVHKPNWFAPREKRGTLVGAYACALLDNGETVFEPVSAEDLELARAQNRGKSPAWATWPDQQRQKVALKRLQKYLPKGPADRALEIDEDPGTRPRGIIDAEGHEVTVDDEQPQQQGPLDRAVEQHKVEQQVQQTQGGSQTTLDREQLFGMLCDADERWQRERARVDAWDEIEALSALAFLRTILGDGVGLDGTPPTMPDCMRLPRDAA